MTRTSTKDYSDPKTCISAEPRSREDLTGLIKDVDDELAVTFQRIEELKIERAGYAKELTALAA